MLSSIPRRACSPRRAVVLTAGLISCLSLLACSQSGSHPGIAARPVQSAGGVLNTVGGRRTTPTGRHTFGDYDDDDGYYDVHESDNDNDDATGPVDEDGDSDGSPGPRYDSDDGSVLRFGHAARPADQHMIETLIRSYYALAVAKDGAKACSLIFSPIAKSYPQSLGVGGPFYLRGSKTCGEIASKFMGQNHQQAVADAASLTIDEVRVSRNLGLAVLSFKDRPERQAEVIRERRTWKMQTLLDNELP